MATANYIIDTASGALVACGFCEMVAGSGQSVVSIEDGEIYSPVDGWKYDAPDFVFDLEGYKIKKCSVFDEKNIELRAAGALYATHRFPFTSASGDEVKANWIGAYGAKDVLSYPYKVKTDVRGVRYNVTDAADFDALYNALFFYAQWIVSSSGDLEEQVHACTTKAEVDAIVDTRTPDTPYI